MPIALLDKKGLIDFNDFKAYEIESKGKPYRSFSYCDTIVCVKNEDAIRMGNIMLTDMGLCLCEIIQAEKADDEYLQICCDYWKRHGCEVDIQ